MGIGFTGFAMGCPAGVGDANVAVSGILVTQSFQLCNLAQGPAALELILTITINFYRGQTC